MSRKGFGDKSRSIFVAYNCCESVALENRRAVSDCALRIELRPDFMRHVNHSKIVFAMRDRARKAVLARPAGAITHPIFRVPIEGAAPGFRVPLATDSDL